MNKKVRGSRKARAVDGTLCDSRLEARAYSYFLAAGLRFEFQKRYPIIPTFKYRGETVGRMTWTVDFVFRGGDGREILADTKGYATGEFKLKFKIFRYLALNEANAKGVKPPEIIILPDMAAVYAFTARMLGEAPSPTLPE
jgi:hypothetical protein